MGNVVYQQRNQERPASSKTLNWNVCSRFSKPAADCGATGSTGRKCVGEGCTGAAGKCTLGAGRGRMADWPSSPLEEEPPGEGRRGGGGTGAPGSLPRAARFRGVWDSTLSAEASLPRDRRTSLCFRGLCATTLAHPRTPSTCHVSTTCRVVCNEILQIYAIIRAEYG